MAYRKIMLFGAVLFVLQGCSVLATSIVSNAESSVTTAIGGDAGASCGQFVIPAIIRPILQTEGSAAVTPSVPCFNNYPPCYPPVIIDGGDSNNNNNQLLYFLIFALNRRCGGSGCNSGYGNGCGCNSGYSNGCGYSSGCGNGCGCNGGYGGGGGCNSGYGNGCGCNSGYSNGYGYGNGCGCNTYAYPVAITSDSPCSPVVGANYGDEIYVSPPGCSTGPIKLIITTESDSCSCNGD